MNEILKLSEYGDWLRDLKQQIKTSQIKAALSVNNQLIMLYWDLGRQIVEKQEHAKWGSGFIEQLSKDLQAEFPDMTGFSRANMFRMKKFYQFYSNYINPHEVFVAQPVRQIQSMAENKEITISPKLGGELNSSKGEQPVLQVSLIPWGHNVCIFEKVKNIEQALFYVHKTIENSWSRTVLEYQIETNLYDRQGKAVTNFSVTLPDPQSDLANAIMKDPYNFDFLQFTEKAKETDIERGLTKHIAQFLPELGTGFAYLGRQFLLKIGKKDYRTDLLFYHTRLKCYVIIELKTREFEPEFVGKLNFYINAVNELVRDSIDRPTIGILLVKNKDNYEVEFSLRDVNNPIGVSAYHYKELAKDIRAALPSEEELNLELLKYEHEYENKR